MDAVEMIMLREGYAALSARSIARCADVNYQLIFYYFENLDGLLLATYRRRTQRMLDELKLALEQERPLRALWQVASNAEGARLSLEYMAMSNHKSVIRAETLSHVQMTEKLVFAAMKSRVERDGLACDPSSQASAAMVIAMLGTNLGLQIAQGIEGRSIDDARRIVEQWIEALDAPHSEQPSLLLQTIRAER